MGGGVLLRVSQRAAGATSQRLHNACPTTSAAFSLKSLINQTRTVAQCRDDSVGRMALRGTSATSTVVELITSIDKCRAACTRLASEGCVAVDMEGVNLSRTGELCLVQVRGSRG